jgi:hypothetical protein
MRVCKTYEAGSIPATASTLKNQPVSHSIRTRKLPSLAGFLLPKAMSSRIIKHQKIVGACVGALTFTIRKRQVVALHGFMLNALMVAIKTTDRRDIPKWLNSQAFVDGRPITLQVQQLIIKALTIGWFDFALDMKSLDELIAAPVQPRFKKAVKRKPLGVK